MALHTINVPITECVHVYSEAPNSNYSSDSYLAFSSDSGKVYRALLKWGNINIPNRKIVTKFYIYGYFHVAYGARSTELFNIANSWTASTATWSNVTLGGSYLGTTILSNNVNEYNAISVNNPAVAVTWTQGALYSNGNPAAMRKDPAPYIVVEYMDMNPNPPTPIGPIGSYEDNQKDIKFEWQYNSPVGDSQAKFDLLWSSDNGLTWNTITQTTSNNYYNMPADTLPAGNILWRVRTYNEYDEVSEFSEVKAFYTIGAPVAPSILVLNTNSARPTIKWTAQNQQIYHVQVVQNDNIIYDSGSIASLSTFEYQVKKFLPDGNYIAKVRTKNEYNLWSDWGSLAFNISTVKPDKPNLLTHASNVGIIVTFSNIDVSVDYILVYRNNICIAKVASTALQYQDCSCQSGKECNYFIRTVTAAETFNDSDIKTITPVLSNNLLAHVSDLSDVLVLKYTRSLSPDKQQNTSLGGQQKYYSGRKHPIIEYSEFEDNTLVMNFRLKNVSAFQKFIQLVSKKGTLLFRDKMGRKIYGGILSFQATETVNGYIDISFAINETDYIEEVEV